MPVSVRQREPTSDCDRSVPWPSDDWVRDRRRLGEMSLTSDRNDRRRDREDHGVTSLRESYERQLRATAHCDGPSASATAASGPTFSITNTTRRFDLAPTSSFAALGTTRRVSP